MGYRVEACAVSIDLTVEFEGKTKVAFSLPPDDPLVAQLLARNDQINLAAAKTGSADVTIT